MEYLLDVSGRQQFLRMVATMKPRVGLLLLGHNDYPNDLGLRFAQEGARALGQRGLEVVFDGQAHTRPRPAAAAALSLLDARVEGTIVLPGTWLEGETATAAIREVEHLPFALWGLPMFELEGRRESTGSFVAVCSLKGPLERMGYVFKTVLGLPTEEASLAALADFAFAAHAAARLKRLRAGLVGYSAMSIYAGTFDHVLLRRHLGPEVVHLDTYSLVRETERLDPRESQSLAQRVRARAVVDCTEERLLKSCGLAAALRRLVRAHDLDALTVKCQYELSQEYGMTACLPVSLLADEGVVASCEGDMMVLVTQCLLAAATGQVCPYGDILDLQGDTMLLSSCGFAPLSLAHEQDTCRVCEFGHPGFDGLICSFTLRRGPVTLARLAEGRASYRLLYTTGEGVETDLRQGRFPALRIHLCGDPQALLSSLASQHFALCYGDITGRLEDWCRMTGVEGVRV